MNDTRKPCHAVDFDGTLAEYDHWRGNVLGRPIPAMVERVRAWLRAGHEVVVFTARASQPEDPHHAEIVHDIERWTRVHIGTKLEVTAVKSYRFTDIWDDRAVSVLPNQGLYLDPMLAQGWIA